MRKAIQYKVGRGFVLTHVNIDVVRILLATTKRLELHGVSGTHEECSYQDLRYIPEGTIGMKFDDNLITHWEFPNFNTLEIPETFLQELYIPNKEEIIVLGCDPKFEIGYISNKSDGYGYYQFSCYAKGWFKFAWYKRRIYFLGEGYCVGHTEVVGQQCVSTYCQGQIDVCGNHMNILRKPLYSQPNLRNGHKEGVIVEIHGVEHRIKVEKTHDLVVTYIEENAVVVETSEGHYRFKYRRPNFSVNLGDIVECANTFVLKVRDDKRIAEPKDAYERIEASLTYMTFVKALRRGLEHQMITDRYQVFPEPKIIKDEKLFDSVLLTGTLVSLQGKFYQYQPRDIVKTVAAVGALIESLDYHLVKRLGYSDFLSMYQEAGADFTDAIKNVEEDGGFDFGLSSGLDRVITQDDDIVKNVDNQIAFEVGRDLSSSRLLDIAIRVVEEMPILSRTKHLVTCANQILPYSNIHCSACTYRNAIKYIVNYVSSFGEFGDTGVTPYGLVKRNVRRGIIRRNGSRVRKKGDIDHGGDD